MRIIVLVLLLVFMTSFAFADVTCEVVEIEQDSRNHVVVWANFKLDGVDIPQKEVRQGKPVWGFYMTYRNLINKTEQQVKNWLKINFEWQCDNYIKEEFRRKTNSNIVVDGLYKLEGKSFTKESANVDFDTNNNRIVDTRWTVKTDGTYVETNIPE